MHKVCLTCGFRVKERAEIRCVRAGGSKMMCMSRFLLRLTLLLPVQTNSSLPYCFLGLFAASWPCCAMLYSLYRQNQFIAYWEGVVDKFKQAPTIVKSPNVCNPYGGFNSDVCNALKMRKSQNNVEHLNNFIRMAPYEIYFPLRKQPEGCDSG